MLLLRWYSLIHYSIWPGRKKCVAFIVIDFWCYLQLFDKGEEEGSRRRLYVYHVLCHISISLFYPIQSLPLKINFFPQSSRYSIVRNTTRYVVFSFNGPLCFYFPGINYAAAAAFYYVLSSLFPLLPSDCLPACLPTSTPSKPDPNFNSSLDFFSSSNLKSSSVLPARIN